MTDILDYALAYAEDGLSVFPIHTARNGMCDCSKGEWCDNPGKHPRTPHGFKDATTDEALIRNWWKRWPEANIAVATGSVSGRVVLDVDGPEGAEALKGKHLPPTVVSHTARGVHYWFRTPADGLRSAVAILPKVDVRGEGGYVVAPPSLHGTGVRYRWDQTLTPKAVGFVDCPVWLVELASKRTPAPSRSPEQWRRIAARGVREGERHATLCALAGKVFSPNPDPACLYELLHSWNRDRCEPPLPYEEAERIICDIALREAKKRERA